MGYEEALRLIKEAVETGETMLDLSNQGLTELPPDIVQLTDLKQLRLDGNPLISPPYELAVQGIDAIREYFALAEEGEQVLAEVKVIFLGEGASGKTSLTRCLLEEQFNQCEEITHGIRINDWILKTDELNLRCHLWDFGGQEIMHATHQFFLSRHSLYVLVLDGRRDERPEYWLRYIESFGGGSPVLVVLNKYDINPSFDINRPFLKKKYPFIINFYRISCRTGNGIQAFRQALEEELGKLPLTRIKWPASWFRAKAMLEQMSEPRISYEKFEDICLQAGVLGESSRTVLADFLHDLGVIIHFADFTLNDNHVLDPKWITGAVYRIINAPLVAANKGLLRLNDLKELLAWQEDEGYRWYPADHVYITELMKKFELCYESAENEVLIPQLLAVPEPSFTFDEQNALHFALAYKDFLPPSIMPRFIVKRHQEIKDELRWRTGVVLNHPLLDTIAVVRADNEARQIHIAVTGKERKVYLALIWLSLREINTGYEGLKVSERIPLPDQPSISVSYETLLKSQEAGMEKFFPEGAENAYSIQELLAVVHPENQSESGKMQEMLERYERRVKNNPTFSFNPSVFGVGINFNALFDDLLRRHKK